MSPFLILTIGIAFILFAIVVLRLHPFLALIVAALLVGVLSALSGRMSLPDAVQKTAENFGATAAQVGIVIALAAIVGQCLMESGAADRIVRSFFRLMGQERAPFALLGSGYVLSVPVFFDTVFFLLVPLAKAMRVRTGKNYVLYILAIGAGGAVTHSLVPPTPGPILMAQNLGVDLGATILAGFLVGLFPAVIGGWFYARLVDRRLEIPLRETPGVTLKELEELAHTPDATLPRLWVSLLPVILPVVLITSHTVVKVLEPAPETGPPSLAYEITGFLGNPNFSLLVAAVISMVILARHKRYSLRQLEEALAPAIATAGVIILITAAGGAFGKMLRAAGVEESLRGAADWGIPILFLGFLVATVMKIAQGSGTVSMMTTSAMMAGFVTELSYHPVYLLLAIGSGSLVGSWMNDSGFWVVARMSGFTEGETLKTWTLLLVLLGIVGFVVTLLLVAVMPNPPLPG